MLVISISEFIKRWLKVAQAYKRSIYKEKQIKSKQTNQICKYKIFWFFEKQLTKTIILEGNE